MGLQFWLPLNGSLNNQGLSNTIITNNGATVNTSGKFGKCYAFDGTQFITIKSNDIQNIFQNPQSNFSMACWIYLNSDETDRVIIFGNYAANPFVNWELAANGTQRLCAGGLSDFSNRTNAAVVPKETWTHIAVTYNGSLTTFYVNGILQGAYNGANTLTTKTASNTFWLGSDQRSGATRLKGRINDFRLYDCCLSVKEIEKISKGLALHYPLAMPGQENLIVNSNNFSGWSINSIFTINQISTGEYVASASRTGATSYVWNRIIPTIKFNPELYPNGITVSFDFKCDDISALDHKCICSLQIYNSSNTRIGWYEAKNSFIETNYTGSTMLENGVWKRLSCYFNQSNLKTISSSNYTVNDVSYTMLSFNLVKNGSISFKNIKVEKGKIATPWIPNSADTKYIVLGYNDNIEYDVSGFGHNGMKTGTFEYDIDTPRYSTSTIFNGSNYIAPGQLHIKDELTYNWWAYVDNWGSSLSGSMVSSIESGGMGHQNSGSTYLHFYCGTGTTANNYGNAYQMPAPSAGWHMFTETWDGYNFKVYLDGELKFTDARYTSKTPMFYGSNRNALFIGGESSGSLTVPADRFKGKISDVRVYATALSAEDIKKLYNISNI